MDFHIILGTVRGDWLLTLVYNPGMSLSFQTHNVCNFTAIKKKTDQIKTCTWYVRFISGMKLKVWAALRAVIWESDCLRNCQSEMEGLVGFSFSDLKHSFLDFILQHTSKQSWFTPQDIYHTLQRNYNCLTITGWGGNENQFKRMIRLFWTQYLHFHFLDRSYTLSSISTALTHY